MNIISEYAFFCIMMFTADTFLKIRYICHIVFRHDCVYHKNEYSEYRNDIFGRNQNKLYWD